MQKLDIMLADETRPNTTAYTKHANVGQIERAVSPAEQTETEKKQVPTLNVSQSRKANLKWDQAQIREPI